MGSKVSKGPWVVCVCNEKWRILKLKPTNANKVEVPETSYKYPIQSQALRKVGRRLSEGITILKSRKDKGTVGCRLPDRVVLLPFSLLISVIAISNE